MNKSPRKNTLLGMYAETSIHAGTGQNTGVVDLPIQRESHTDWPCIYGSSLKGAMRAEAVARMGEHESIRHVFGPDPVTENPSDHAGALSVSDARLLLLPVRSLSSSFCWAACPEVLKRLQRDMSRASMNMEFAIPDEPSDDGAWWHDKHNEQNRLFLEEYQFNAQQQDLSALIGVLARFLPRDDAAEVLQRRLVILSDAMFSHLCKYATPVAAHVRLDENKTVAPGALWYEETLPPDTLMYSLISASASRKDKQQFNAGQILQSTLELLRDPGYLQVGGNETVGMGWFRVKEVIN